MRTAGANPNCTIIFDRVSTRSADATGAGTQAFVQVSARTGLTSRYVSEGEGLVSMDCSCYHAAEPMAEATPLSEVVSGAGPSTEAGTSNGAPLREAAAAAPTARTP